MAGNPKMFFCIKGDAVRYASRHVYDTLIIARSAILVNSYFCDAIAIGLYKVKILFIGV